MAGLKEFPDNHFHSCVCDPPYEFGFMGKEWDKTGIAYSVEMWREVRRVLKPGAHLLAFGGSRTYHRMACAVEDAGFEIRDQIMWLYGSGFPKSLDVSKAIDKAEGAIREVVGKKGGRSGDPKQDIRGGNFIHGPADRIDCSALTAPATEAARQWEGWGTALKPAHEPIVVARKPLEGTVIKNVLKWGCGALNIAGCLITFERGSIGDRIDGPKRKSRGTDIWCNDDGSFDLPRNYKEPAGRWPANVIHDGSEEVVAEFEKYGERKAGAGNTGHEPSLPGKGEVIYGFRKRVFNPSYGDTGSASRFYYCAKASPAERDWGLEFRKPLQRDESRKEGNPGGDNPRNRGVNPVKNNHPTVKPLALMRYLVRLVTPPGGVILDGFCGSGTTLIAAAQEGFCAVGIDLEMDNCQLAERRCRGHLGMLSEILINCKQT